ncbi:MAG: helix-hairpin-helix domain-containing protein [Candidatus Edwardsbacteria bacterium]|nr:helix-hairpin-helix domain-containing protein [Candidatus Edwardsbacteria bacterium]
MALGNAVLLYKKRHPVSAPELKYGGPELPQVIERPGSFPAGPEAAAKNQWPVKKIPAEKIDLNRAGPRDLEKLPAIGPAMAKKIIDFRKESGDFRKVEDLMKVKGIGHKKFNRLREHVFVDH